mmetsp:Transcript_84569/g.159355  ORF Transcript_84569/g.159355 Transcript_84569/m.159355 type:complete len:241 (-) Transcript_84569:1611-2333(-)
MCNPDIPLASILHVVLIQEVIQRFVERVAMHHDKADRLLHVALDALQVHSYKDITLVIGKGAAKHDLCFAVVQEVALEEKPERRVVLREQHQVPSIQLHEVLHDELCRGEPVHVFIHATAEEEFSNADVQIILRATAEVALDRLHQHVRLKGRRQSLRCALLDCSIDHPHSAVELAHAPEVFARLILVNLEEGLAERPQVSLKVRCTHHALGSCHKVFYGWRWPVQRHAAAHLGCIQCPV